MYNGDFDPACDSLWQHIYITSRTICWYSKGYIGHNPLRIFMPTLSKTQPKCILHKRFNQSKEQAIVQKEILR